MTNYENFPKHRKNGIVIKFKECQYSWSENNARQRKYLLESDYLKNAVEVYVWENDTTYTNIDDFKEYLRNKKDEGTCPLCGKPLVRRQSHSDYMNIFLGCSGCQIVNSQRRHSGHLS